MIFAMQISLLRILDPDGDPARHQNLITWSMSHALPLQEISSKSVHDFFSYPTDRQTDRQTDRSKNITSFFGRGNNNDDKDKFLAMMNKRRI